MLKVLQSGILIILILSSCQSNEKVINVPGNKPNIIYILADDLSYGDLSCYGQTKFSTPHIDNLAKEGMQFTQHYAGCTVCAPSRSTLLTGQHTGHTFIRGNKEVQPEGQFPLESSAITVAELLKEAGYVTGAFGKWGLGYPGSEGDPNKQGFDEFYGYNCQRMGHNYYPYYLWHNQNKINLKGNSGKQTEEYGPEIIHRKALQFLEKNKDKPFFLYYPSILPHAELAAPEEFLTKYRGKFEPEKSFSGIDDGELYKNGGYSSQPESHAAFAAMVDYLDAEVGEIVAKLKELDIFDNTIIIFSSDNGPHLEGGADPDFFNSNGSLRGYKRDVYEGGIRVPLIVCWKDKIPAGSQSDHVSEFWDLLPTLAEISGFEAPSNIDGISFLPALTGRNQDKHHYLYWEFHELGGRIALRKNDWKLVVNNFSDPEKTSIELYNLTTDIGETSNLANRYPERVKELYDLIKTARTDSEIFPFN